MKSFKKNFIVYGFLPIISKASGLILLPFYTHYFNLVDFGYLELFLTLFSFTTLLINLEIYTAIGRYFYDENTLEGKVKLISSGLGLNIIFSILVVCFLFFNINSILSNIILQLPPIIWFKISSVCMLIDLKNEHIRLRHGHEKSCSLSL